MLIEFEKLPESVVPHFYGGEKEMRARMFSDSLCRIGVGTLLLSSRHTGIVRSAASEIAPPGDRVVKRGRSPATC